MNFFSKFFGRKSNKKISRKDFILTDIEQKKIQGKTYVFQYVKFQGRKMPIVGVVADFNSSYVIYGSKRPREYSEIGEQEYIITISEYFSDMIDINYFLNGENPLTEKSFYKVSDFICDKHVKDAGRLIDSDLYTYIDFIIIAKNGIWEKLKNRQLNDGEVETLWIALKNYLFRNFEDYIYLTKIEEFSIMGPKFSLVKLKS